MEELFGIYADFFEVMSDVETGIMQLETVVLNGKKHKANRYIEMAIQEIRRAVSYMSDAEFEITTSPLDMSEG